MTSGSAASSRGWRASGPSSRRCCGRTAGASAPRPPRPRSRIGSPSSAAALTHRAHPPGSLRPHARASAPRPPRPRSRIGPPFSAAALAHRALPRRNGGAHLARDRRGARGAHLGPFSAKWRNAPRTSCRGARGAHLGPFLHKVHEVHLATAVAAHGRTRQPNRLPGGCATARMGGLVGPGGRRAGSWPPRPRVASARRCTPCTLRRKPGCDPVEPPRCRGFPRRPGPRHASAARTRVGAMQSGPRRRPVPRAAPHRGPPRAAGRSAPRAAPCRGPLRTAGRPVPPPASAPGPPRGRGTQPRPGRTPHGHCGSMRRRTGPAMPVLFRSGGSGARL